MNIAQLQTKFDQLKLSFTTIEENRKLWKDEKRELLKNTLSRIKSESGLDLQVQSLSHITNSEGVNLMFNKVNSGIYQKTDKSFKSYTKHGGYIVFSQAYNGKIFVIISYPYIEELVSQAPVTLLGKYNPENITEAFIYDMAGLFLDEMIKWEADTSIDSEIDDEFSSNPVGFVYGRTTQSDPNAS